ncbi:MAG: hypothetical protein A2X67_11645 [Ignavibacteria bacterium GWA2_55_11]|nr:MAG: hypothetical protein A2X67_11645 [Ignavibacteria bacterium GWA2_55_11]
MVRNRPLLLLLSLTLCTNILAQPSRLIRVPQDRRTIQSAVDAAHVGDTILVDHGVYFENIRIHKNIVLASRFIIDRDTTHVSRTVIDGSKAKDERMASTVLITGPTDTACALIGFTIRGGSGSYGYFPNDPTPSHWIVGGGVLVRHAGATIANNRGTQNILSPRSCEHSGQTRTYKQSLHDHSKMTTVHYPSTPRESSPFWAFS